uniref:CD276 antigen homolog isoform X2 n=1 Tax=Epinephelus lanceolatus TaxID=310571 RepID=UPI001444BD39|nr:CD276 antigen homolog isoform X2 [Epinephelus lanceolatus]
MSDVLSILIFLCSFFVLYADTGVTSQPITAVEGKDHLQTQMAQYKDRTTLIHEDLTRGIVTLIISSVKLSDSGQYKGFVPQLDASWDIDLSVVPKDPQNRTRRDDSSTTKPPVEGVTKSDDEGAAKTEPLWKNVLIVCCCVAAAIVVIVLILLKLGKIKNCMRTNGGRREQEANVTNGIESIPLRTTTQDDLNHDGPGNNVQVV